MCTAMSVGQSGCPSLYVLTLFCVYSTLYVFPGSIIQMFKKNFLQQKEPDRRMNNADMTVALYLSFKSTVRRSRSCLSVTRIEKTSLPRPKLKKPITQNDQRTIRNQVVTHDCFTTRFDAESSLMGIQTFRRHFYTLIIDAIIISAESTMVQGLVIYAVDCWSKGRGFKTPYTDDKRCDNFLHLWPRFVKLDSVTTTLTIRSEWEDSVKYKRIGVGGCV